MARLLRFAGEIPDLALGRGKAAVQHRDGGRVDRRGFIVRLTELGRLELGIGDIVDHAAGCRSGRPSPRGRSGSGSPIGLVIPATRDSLDDRRPAAKALGTVRVRLSIWIRDPYPKMYFGRAGAASAGPAVAGCSAAAEARPAAPAAAFHGPRRAASECVMQLGHHQAPRMFENPLRQEVRRWTRRREGASRAVQRENQPQAKTRFPDASTPHFLTTRHPRVATASARTRLDWNALRRESSRRFPGSDSTRLFPERKYLYPGSQRVEDRHAFAIRRGVSQAVTSRSRLLAVTPGTGIPRRSATGSTRRIRRSSGGRQGTEIDLCDETGAEPDHPPRRGYYRRGDCDTIDVPDLHILMNTGVAISNKGTVHLPAYAP